MISKISCDKLRLSSKLVTKNGCHLKMSLNEKKKVINSAGPEGWVSHLPSRRSRDFFRSRGRPKKFLLGKHFHRLLLPTIRNTIQWFVEGMSVQFSQLLWCSGNTLTSGSETHRFNSCPRQVFLTIYLFSERFGLHLLPLFLTFYSSLLV